MQMFERTSRATTALSITVASLLITLGLAACGSSDEFVSVSAYPGTPIDSRAAGLVPEKYQGKELIAGSTFGLPPMEFFDGKTAAGDEKLTGADIDLARAIASTLGLKLVFEDVPFDQILSGVESGTYDLGVSSITDTRQREAEVDFVTYLSAGSRFYGASKSSPVKDISGACGRTAVVIRGTIYDDLFAGQAAKCPGSRKLRIEYVSEPGQIDRTLENGGADVAASDTPIVSWAVRNSSGRLEAWGEPFGVEPYGIAVAKGSGMAQAIRAALERLIADGTYSSILEKWGLQAGAISEPVVDGAVR